MFTNFKQSTIVAMVMFSFLSSKTFSFLDISKRKSIFFHITKILAIIDSNAEFVCRGCLDSTNIAGENVYFFNKNCASVVIRYKFFFLFKKNSFSAKIIQRLIAFGA